MKTGAGMLVFGVIIAIAFSYGQDEPNAVTGWAALIAIAGFITAIVGLGKWRERPAGD
jgi:small-conductance mechanosensitive channel